MDKTTTTLPDRINSILTKWKTDHSGFDSLDLDLVWMTTH